MEIYSNKIRIVVNMAKSSLSFEEEERIRSKFIALLLSGAERPIKTRINFQKELFIFSKSFPKFFDSFDFVPHYYGPYSRIAEDIIENYDDYFISDKKGIYLTSEGKKLGEESIREFSEKNRDPQLKSIVMKEYNENKEVIKNLKWVIYEDNELIK